METGKGACIFICLLSLSFSTCCVCRNSSSIELKGDRGVRSQKEYAQDELLLKFKNKMKDEEIKDFLEVYGFTVIKKIEGQKVYQVKIPVNKSVWEMVESVSKDFRIQYVEPNYIRSVH